VADATHGQTGQHQGGDIGRVTDAEILALMATPPAPTASPQRKVTRWEHEDTLDAMQTRLDQTPDAMRTRRQTVEHPFGTIKAWMGATHKKAPENRARDGLYLLVNSYAEFLCTEAKGSRAADSVLGAASSNLSGAVGNHKGCT